MKEETLETLVREAIAYADGSLTFAFQGGEPTLAGLDFFQKAVELQQKYNNKKLQIENTIQTNGLLIDEKWARFLGEHRFLVGLSLDGPKKMHDRYRKDAGGQDTFARIMHSVQLLEQYHVDYNVVTVVTNDTAKQASFLYKFWKRNHYPFVQFIPCMDEIKRQDGTQECSIYAVEPEQYGKFLCELFDLWYADFVAGETMDIRMFSNLAQMAAGYPAEECGMNGCCNCYFVVEGDGSVYPCDFYCMDAWKLGTVKDGFVQMKTSEKAKAFVEASRPVCATCHECPYFSLCRGGCRRWREPFVDGKPGLNQLCSAYRMFFAHAAERMERLGVYIRQKYAENGK
jgi:anaerobic sulfatase maturase